MKMAVLKYFPIRPEGHGGAVFLAGAGSLDADRAKGNAALIALDIRIPILVHLIVFSLATVFWPIIRNRFFAKTFEQVEDDD